MLLNNPNFSIQRTSTINNHFENGSGIILPIITEENFESGHIGGMPVNQDLLNSSILYSNNVSESNASQRGVGDNLRI
jgi:hypothetical protein